jgi:uncharacterized protein YdeI (YjbR/CyaY-like superfamily)
VQQHFGDAHVRNIFGPDHAIYPGILHLASTQPEEGRLRQSGVELVDELGSVVVATRLAGREKNTRIGPYADVSSVDFSREGCMASNAAKRFRAVLEPLPGGLGWVIARLPFDPVSAWKKRVRLRVTVEINNEVFRTSLFSDAAREGYFVLVNKKMQKAADAKVGTMVEFTIAPDLQERVPEIPPELAKLLKSERALSKWFAGLSDSMRYEIGKWIVGVKGAEARQRRAEQMAERLMLTMEGEKVLPPIFEVAFSETPAGLKGWKAMTPTQRRRHLMGVFYYQSPEAREKRVEKLIEDALRIARG